MRKILSTIITLLITVVSYSQVQEAWAVSFNYANPSRDVANVNAVDQYGNVYVAGVNAPGGASDDYITIMKYDTHGNELWRHTYGGDLEFFYQMHPVALVLDNENVYVAATSNVHDKVFIVLKYDLDGHFRWLKQFAGVGDFDWGHATDMAVDPTGNVYVTGFISEEAGIDPEQLVSNYFTVKLDALTGDQKWVKTYNGAEPGNGINIPSSIAVDPTGNVYITGKSSLNGEFDIATIKYNTSGSTQWVQRYNGAGNGEDAGNDIALDANNDVYVAGYTAISSSNRDRLAIKYSGTSSDQLWIKISGASNVNEGSNLVLVDGDQNIYVTDYSYRTAKYKSDGTELWANNYTHSIASAMDIAVDGENNVYVTGKNSQSLATLRFNSGNGSTHWEKIFGPEGGDFLFLFRPKTSIAVDVSGNVFVSAGWNQVADDPDPSDFVTIKYTQCNITCPSNITVNNDPGKCDAVVTFADVTYTGDCGGTLTYSHASGATFPVGTTTVTVTSDETGASCSFTITVNDNQLPVLICPANKSVNMNAGVCYATVDPGLATATDNCSATVAGVRSDNLALNANYPGGVTTITWTATDPSNNTSTSLQTITVVDNEPPVIAGESASVVVLSPSNHTMRDVAISYTVTDNCAATTTLSIISNEPVNGTGDGDTDPDYIVTDNRNVKLRAERSANGNGRIYTVTITATDGSGNTAIKTVEVKVPHNIKNPHSGQPFKVGSTVTFEGEFWDKTGNTHSAKWLIDENTTVKATVTEPAGNKNGKVTGTYKFTAPGVYKLQMNVTDQKGITHYSNTAGDLEAIVVIYDPNGGFAYGGGYYNSPAGALRSSPSATGKASYGFTLNYFKNSTYPKGETQFDFKVGSFEFNALNFEYLVINNSMSQFKGTGKIIGGQSGVGFTMTVVDGQLDGSGVDKIRMKIYNRSNGSIIYDNQPGASDAALPTQAVGTNSTIVISGTNSSLTQSNTTQKAEMEATAPEVSGGLDVIAFPNPSVGNFTINVKSNSRIDKITMHVIDMYGRIIETRNVNARSPIRFGDRYHAGTYFVRIMQGKEYKELKLIKLSD